MADKHDQERYREEDLMARRPVSRGASNKNAPMNSKKQPPDSEADANPSDQQQQPDYNKMLQNESSGPPEGRGMAVDHTPGSPGGGTLPAESETGRTTGGMNTSNSTVGAGGSSTGAVTRAGATRDRGYVTDTDLNQTTNTEDELDRNSRRDSQPKKP